MQALTELFRSYLTVYALLLAAAATFYSLAYLIYVFGSLRASRLIHKVLLESVLGTTLRCEPMHYIMPAAPCSFRRSNRWLDKTPTSRVIARCTQDIRAGRIIFDQLLSLANPISLVDGPISQNFSYVLELSLSLAIKLGAVILFTPIFVFPGIFVAFLGAWCGQIYIKAQLSVKREMSNARAPVLGHFGAAIAGLGNASVSIPLRRPDQGLVSIRAYGAQDAFKGESLTRIDRYTRTARTFYNLNR